MVAGVIAAGCTFLVSWLVGLANQNGLSEFIPNAVLMPISAAAVYPIAFWTFDVWLWHFGPIRMLVDIPNLKGSWTVEGQTLNEQKVPIYDWKGEITIFQTWDKIKVKLTTKNSSSDSITASLVRDPARGYVLMYSYGNSPAIGSVELAKHQGYCEIAFDREAKVGNGEYFNNKGRTTFGTMALRRNA